MNEDIKALEDAGFVIADYGDDRIVKRADGSVTLRPDDYIVRRKPRPAPVESECERLFIEQVATLRGDNYLEALRPFRAALAREIAAAEQRGYDKGFKRGCDMVIPDTLKGRAP